MTSHCRGFASRTLLGSGLVSACLAFVLLLVLSMPDCLAAGPYVVVTASVERESTNQPKIITRTVVRADGIATTEIGYRITLTCMETVKLSPSTPLTARIQNHFLLAAAPSTQGYLAAIESKSFDRLVTLCSTDVVVEPVITKGTGLKVAPALPVNVCPVNTTCLSTACPPGTYCTTTVLATAGTSCVTEKAECVTCPTPKGIPCETGTECPENSACLSTSTIDDVACSRSSSPTCVCNPADVSGCSKDEDCSKTDAAKPRCLVTQEGGSLACPAKKHGACGTCPDPSGDSDPRECYNDGDCDTDAGYQCVRVQTEENCSVGYCLLPGEIHPTPSPTVTNATPSASPSTSPSPVVTDAGTKTPEPVTETPEPTETPTPTTETPQPTETPTPVVVATFEPEPEIPVTPTATATTACETRSVKEWYPTLEDLRKLESRDEWVEAYMGPNFIPGPPGSAVQLDYRWSIQVPGKVKDAWVNAPRDISKPFIFKRDYDGEITYCPDQSVITFVFSQAGNYNIKIELEDGNLISKTVNAGMLQGIIDGAACGPSKSLWARVTEGQSGLPADAISYAYTSVQGGDAAMDVFATVFDGHVRVSTLDEIGTGVAKEFKIAGKPIATRLVAHGMPGEHQTSEKEHIKNDDAKTFKLGKLLRGKVTYVQLWGCCTGDTFSLWNRKHVLQALADWLSTPATGSVTTGAFDRPLFIEKFKIGNGKRKLSMPTDTNYFEAKGMPHVEQCRCSLTYEDSVTSASDCSDKPYVWYTGDTPDSLKKKFPTLSFEEACKSISKSGLRVQEIFSPLYSGSPGRCNRVNNPLKYATITDGSCSVRLVPDTGGLAQHRNCKGDILPTNKTLNAGESLCSSNIQYAATMQKEDGNLVVYRGTSPEWNAGISAHAGATVTMQNDCNLVVHKAGTPIYHSNTFGRGKNCYLKMQDDGNLVIYDGSNKAIWSSWFGIMP